MTGDSNSAVGELLKSTGGKIVLLVADGLGGLPQEPGGMTELESARTPNLDFCVRNGVCGLATLVAPGITPGSGPGHLSLFGYDPLRYRIGRGALEAMGIGFDFREGDVAVRGNFVTLRNGLIVDRRAGRPSTDHCKRIVAKLNQVKVSDAEVFVEPVKEQRFVVVFRGEGLGDKVNNTDPQAIDVPPLTAEGADEASRKTATIGNEFVAQVIRILKNDAPTNGCTLRGFARSPNIVKMQEVFGLRAAAIAVYPMYKGLARLVGMTVVDTGDTIESQVVTLQNVWAQYDLFFLHYKQTDIEGEDGSFAKKVEAIEKLDKVIPEVLAMKPDVFIVTGDHSTPSKLKSHSWHAVPTLLLAGTCRPDRASKFGESDCLLGGLGQFHATELIPLALAHAGRLSRFLP